MRMVHVQFQLRWLMVAIAVLAIILSMSAGTTEFLVFFFTILVLIILVPAAIAPSGRRIETAYWAMALHPLLLLVWIAAWRLPGRRAQLYPHDKDLLHALQLTIPYFVAYLSRFYLPIFGFIGWASAKRWFPRRSLSEPLMFLPITWITTLVVLIWDPFELQDWFWD